MKTITAEEARALIKTHDGIYLGFYFSGGPERLVRIRNKTEARRLLKGIAPKLPVRVELDSYNRVIIHADAPAYRL